MILVLITALVIGVWFAHLESKTENPATLPAFLFCIVCGLVIVAFMSAVIISDKSTTEEFEIQSLVANERSWTFLTSDGTFYNKFVPDKLGISSNGDPQRLQIQSCVSYWSLLGYERCGRPKTILYVNEDVFFNEEDN